MQKITFSYFLKIIKKPGICILQLKYLIIESLLLNNLCYLIISYNTIYRQLSFMFDEVFFKIQLVKQ